MPPARAGASSFSKTTTDTARDVGGGRYGRPVTLPALDLDLEIFSGPFDLLLALVLREEVDLLDLELADVVLAYLDHLEGRGELDLETATEFIVLIAALLELKSRLMLAEDSEELLDIEPGEAAEELLERMLQARRYRSASAHLLELFRPRRACAFAARRCRHICARRSPRPATTDEIGHRTPRCSVRRSGGCCGCRPRSTCAISRSSASPSPSASIACARCSKAATSPSRRRYVARIA